MCLHSIGKKISSPSTLIEDWGISFHMKFFSLMFYKLIIPAGTIYFCLNFVETEILSEHVWRADENNYQLQLEFQTYFGRKYLFLCLFFSLFELDAEPHHSFTFFLYETILPSMVSSLAEVCSAMGTSGDIHVIFSVSWVRMLFGLVGPN